MSETQILNLIISKRHIVEEKQKELKKAEININKMVEQYRDGDKGIQSLLVKTLTKVDILEQEINSINLDINRLESRLI